MTQIITSPKEWIELTTAYRYYDVQSKFLGNNYQRNPLTPAHRTFFNSDIRFLKNWNWDLTISWNGKSRIPSTKDNPEEFQLNDWSDAFWLTNSQIKYSPKKSWDFYLGAENLFNYRQDNPIINPENPYDKSFDASLVWGPVFGTKVYAGIKLKI